MASDQTPLLASHRQSISSDHSDQLAEAEDAALHQDQPSASQASRRGRHRLRETLIFVWALAATVAVILIALWTQHRFEVPLPGDDKSSGPALKRNLIFMVSDGMGPASLSLTRSFRQHVDGLPADDVLTLDRHFWGSSRTRSSNSLITDSAAGATAFSCGRKSYNGAISVLPDRSPCGTVLEAAKKAGYKTGLVVTTDITDATPACFASHVHMRAEEDEIALQEVGEGPLGRVVDLMLGGGRCHFLPNATDGSMSDSCREDDLDVLRLAQDKHGWNYVDNRDGFDRLKGGDKAKLPLLGLFALENVPFEIDRPHAYPSLSEMARTALRVLERATEDSEKGFFLMIEGSRIDHAGHINDPAAQVREVLEYDRTFQEVLDFLEHGKDGGVLVATSDHETGGLSTAYQKPHELPVYGWHPSVLARANASAEYLAARLLLHVSSLSDADRYRSGNKSRSAKLKSWIKSELLAPYLGIDDASDAELDALVANAESGASITVFAGMLSRRARIGWGTHGHSAVDVNVYCSGGPDAKGFKRGNMENTDVGKFLRDYLAVDVEAVTDELKEKMGRVDGAVTDAGAHGHDDLLVPAAYGDAHPVQWMGVVA